VITEREKIIYSSELNFPRYVDWVRLYDKTAEARHSNKPKLKLWEARSLSPEAQHEDGKADCSYPPTTDVNSVWNCTHTHTHSFLDSE
jgi:hypothetical protein